MLPSNYKHFFQLLDTLPNPITFNELAYDKDGIAYDKIIYVNKSFLNTMGYTTEDIPTDRIWFEKAYPEPEYQEYIFTEWNKAVEASKKADTDLIGFPAKVFCKDGCYRWFSVTTQLEHTIDEKYRTIVFLETDTPQKSKLDLDEISLELIHEKRLLKTIIDTAPIRIFWKDLDGVYLGCNGAFLNDAGLSEESEIIGKTDFDMVWKKDAERFRKDDKEVTDSDIPKLNYVEAQPKENGGALVLSTSKVSLRGPLGQVIGILGIYEDITQEHEAKEKLQSHEKLLIIQSRQAAMGEMISMIAHQWKQPLSAISASVANMSVQLDLNTLYLDDLGDKFIGINEQVAYLSQTISDFSNFFKPGKGLETCFFNEPIEQAFSIIGKLLENNNISVTKEYTTTQSIDIYAKEFQQVCINLLKNAADALMESSQTVKSIHIYTYTKENSLILEISDNGGGIKAAVIEQIFEPYFSTKDEKSGTGLGLYMSKTIIENHLGGTIVCENNQEGALFRISIPLVAKKD